MQVVDFADEYVVAASQLLARRFTALRRVAPDLPKAPPRVSGRGVAAMRDGSLAGFLLSSGGRTRLPDHAADVSCARHAYRGMYGVLAERLASSGIGVHNVAVPVVEADVVQTWFELGFGVDQVKGTRALDLPAARGADVEVRRATAADADVLAELSVELSMFHAGPPMLKPADGPFARHDDARREVARELADPRSAFFVAFDGGSALGFVEATPDQTAAEAVLIGMAYVRDGTRSSGVGTAILARILQWATDEGYGRVRVGWTSANPLSDRFWRGHGFRPLNYRLARTIDGRLLGHPKAFVVADV